MLFYFIAFILSLKYENINYILVYVQSALRVLELW